MLLLSHVVADGPRVTTLPLEVQGRFPGERRASAVARIVMARRFGTLDLIVLVGTFGP